MATVIKDLGAVTAYAYAVEGGYTGTEEEFTELLGNIAIDLAEIENLSVTVTTLPAGSQATASYSDGVLSLGIPKGDKGDTGDTGATPSFSIGEVTTEAAGSPATATITGTAAAPILNLRIPKGADGDVSAASMATAYSTSATYAVGDYVWYSGQLYRCTTAITTAEAWTSGHWTAAKIAEDVGGLKSAVSAEDSVINLVGNYVNYGYDTPADYEANPSGGASRIGIKRDLSRIVLNGTSNYQSRAIRIRLSDTVVRVSTNDDVAAWTSGITLKTGHVYAVSSYLLSGTITKSSSSVDAVVITVYRTGESDSVGKATSSGNRYTRKFTAEAGVKYNIVAYCTNGNTYNNAEVLVVLEDLTESAAADPLNGPVYVEKTITGDYFQQGYWATTEVLTDHTKRICYGTIAVFGPGDRIVYEPQTMEIGFWTKKAGDADYTNVVPYTADDGALEFETDTRVIIQLKKATDAATTPADFDCGLTFCRTQTNIAAEKERLGKMGALKITPMIQGYMTANGVTDGPTRISQKNSLALPYGDRTKLTVRCDPRFKVLIRAGAKPYDLSSNLYWFYDGFSVTLPGGVNYYRVAVARLDNNAEISIDEEAEVGLAVYFEKAETDFSAFDSAANAVMLYAPAGSTNMCYRSLPTFLHTSDVHGDYERVKRFNAYAERLGVTMACVTGDIVGYNTDVNCNQFDWLHEIIKGSAVKYGLCVGNHDSHVGQGTGSYTMVDSDLYNIFYAPVASEIGNATGKVWYYRDLTSEKLRVISLDLYQYGGVWTYTYFTQEQLTWLCTTLASTPANYGVIILMHAQQRSVVKDDAHAAFYQTLRKGDTPEHYNAVDNDGDPVGDIVSAFIRKTTISTEYTQNSGAETLIVSADFTNAASGTEFICYMTGHFHQDTIGYNTRPEGDPKQLVLNVTCGCSVYGGSGYKYLAECSDLPRNAQDATQDAFNVYGIDRANKTIRVARVGCNLNYDFTQREYMAIPYAD